jgi:hypothetical protein
MKPVFFFFPEHTDRQKNKQFQQKSTVSEQLCPQAARIMMLSGNATKIKHKAL